MAITAPPECWAQIARHWRAGSNTLEIAQVLKLRECAVYNSLPRALREEVAA